MNKNITALGKMVKQRREELGWSIHHLADSANLDASYLNRLESGALGNDPSEESIRKIAKALKLDNPEPLLLVAGSAPVLSLEQAWAKEDNRGKLLKYLENMKGGGSR